MVFVTLQYLEPFYIYIMVISTKGYKKKSKAIPVTGREGP
jgi:hypothetical protein